MVRSYRPLAAFLIALIALIASASAPAATLEGSAAYRERIAVPADVVFEVTIEDTARADAPATVIARQRIDNAGLPPYRFALDYDEAALRPNMRPVVRATLRHQGRLLFTTDTMVPLPEVGSPPLQLHLVSARARPAADALPVPSSEPQVLTGMFRYFADAATVTLCADGRRLPVAMEGDYLALERAYSAANQGSTQPLLATVEGLIAARSLGEEGSAPKPALVVQRFVSVWPRESCGQPLADSPLRNTYWKLVRLNGAPVQVPPRQREPHLVFNAKQARAAGSSGCNRIMGSFELDGATLRLGRLAGTMMACPEGMARERAFLDALGQVQGWQVRGSHLELFDAQRQVLARFEAVALR